MNLLENIDFEKYYQLSIDKIIELGPKILLAIFILLIGFRFIKIVLNLWDRVMKKHKIEISLRRFLRSVLSISLKVILLISILSTLGVKMTSFVAILGAAGLAIGLALKGSLSNFAGGFMIIFFKPFKVGDQIIAQGEKGVVDSITIFSTILHTADNQRIIIPNGDLSNSVIINLSAQKNRRVDMTFGIGYEDDLQKAKTILIELIKKDKRILTDPKPFVGISELADSSVNFIVKAWCLSSDYWGIFYAMNENVKLTFDKEGISIPYPQQDIHLHKIKTNNK
jgi:small conductance mechanosensitive channel